MNGIRYDKKRNREIIHSAENMKYTKSLLKLKQQESLLENSTINSVENMKLESEIVQLVLCNTHEVSKKRQILLDNMKQCLEEITEELKSVKFITNHPKEIRELDRNAYKQRLLKLSQKIHDFKEPCQLQSLLQEQITLESELREFEFNLHKYESASGSICKPTSAMSCRIKNKRCYDYKEIKNFHALVARTGHNDSWNDEDHLLFLKMRRKFNNIPALVAAIQTKCPDLTVETIVNHEAWFRTYLNLREKQRSTVKEWRKRKEQEKIKNVDKTKFATSKEILPKELNLKVTEKDVSRMVDKNEIGIKNISDVIDRTNKKKELIRQWKEDKEKKRSLDEEQSKILMASKLATLEKRKKERLKKIEEALVEYRNRRSIEMSLKTSKDDSGSGSEYNPALITAFRKQDKEYVRRRKNLISKFRRPTKMRATNERKSRKTKIHNYSTLFNSTIVWRERCKLKEPGIKKPKDLQYIKDLPHFYVRWRNEESIEIKDALTFITDQ